MTESQAGTSAMSGGLTLSNIGVSFGAVTVLQSVDLRVDAGEIVALVGASGSGKSTLLSVLTGQVEPCAGQVRFDGKPIDSAQRPFAYMPQRDVLLPWRRVRENAMLGLDIARIPRAEARRRVEALLPTFGLAGTGQRYPCELSGGMRQRVSFLRAVVQERPVLLLDEPFGALDAMTREDLQQWLLTMWAAHRWSILFVTHDIREAVRLADRVLVLPSRPGPIAGEVCVSRDIARDERFVSDPRVAPLEAQVYELLRIAAQVSSR